HFGLIAFYDLPERHLVRVLRTANQGSLFVLVVHSSLDCNCFTGGRQPQSATQAAHTREGTRLRFQRFRGFSAAIIAPPAHGPWPPGVQSTRFPATSGARIHLCI